LSWFPDDEAEIFSYSPEEGLSAEVVWHGKAGPCYLISRSRERTGAEEGGKECSGLWRSKCGDSG